MGSNGQFLEIVGRHRSFLLTETKVNFTATGAEAGDILKAIVAQLPSSYGFTTNNVQNIGVIMDVEWNYIDFWDCVVEIVNKAQADCRVDNDLDFHLHKRDTIVNYDEHISEGDNHIKTIQSGTDDYPEVTRVIAIGQDNVGQMLVFTAISDDEGNEIREFVLKDTSANTVEKLQSLAEGKLAELSKRPEQSKYLSFGLETAEPGENIPVIIPRQKIFNFPRILVHTLRFGSKQGGVRSETTMEREPIGTAQIIIELARNERKLNQANNVNKLNFIHHFTFDTDNLTENHNSTAIRAGLLVLELTSDNSGIWESKVKIADNNITKVELRFFGKDLTASNFSFSTNNGTNYLPFSSANVLHDATKNPGKRLKLKVELIKNDLNPQPAAESCSVLFS